MRSSPLFLTAILMSIALAGCAGQPAQEAAEEAFDDFEGQELQATTSTGLIRGVIVDTAIIPIPGATATLISEGLTVETDDEGRFVFPDLEPGMYFVEASKLGYGSVQHSVEVLAGVDKPPIARMMLERVPGTEPHVSPMRIDGIMVCSAQVAIMFATGCLIGAYTDDHSRNYFDVDGTPDFYQSEMTWETTQALAQDACLRNYAGTGVGGSIMTTDACGPSPLVGSADGPTLAEHEVGAGNGIENVVWVSPLGAAGVPVLGVAIDQPFDVYIHMFYNFTPEEGWMFIDDGEPTPPS